MCKKLTCAIVDQKKIGQSILYSLDTEKTYIISNPSSRKLICEPEIVGYYIPNLLQQPIADTLKYFHEQNILNNINVVYILRGGLNFPIEAACSQIGLNIGGVSFLTSERIFLENRVSRIESKYRKINSVDNATVIIGDIIASGETLNNTVRYIEEQYSLSRKMLKNIIVFTIGSDNTLKAIDNLSRKLKQRWCKFEGIWSVFIEGIFTTYPNTGITGLNLPEVDFFLNGALLAPEYRLEIIKYCYSIFERCVIYDGGARRFEQNNHIDNIVAYWRNLCTLADVISTTDFIEEKYGYCIISFNIWQQINHYKSIDKCILEIVYQSEQNFIKEIMRSSLSRISKFRLSMLQDTFQRLSNQNRGLRSEYIEEN